MKIAVSSADGRRICGHAGKSRRWLVREHDGSITRLELAREQLFHYWEGAPGTHPLERMDVVVTASAGDGFIRRMEKCGVRVDMTSETLAQRAFDELAAGRSLPKSRFNPLLLLCKLRDLVGGH